MIHQAGARPPHKQTIVREAEVKHVRARAEHLLKTAFDLLESADAEKAEKQQLAYRLSEEAIALLAEIRGNHPKELQA